MCLIFDEQLSPLRVAHGLFLDLSQQIGQSTVYARVARAKVDIRQYLYRKQDDKNDQNQNSGHWQEFSN